jgi:hypothetical protein
MYKIKLLTCTKAKFSMIHHFHLSQTRTLFLTSLFHWNKQKQKEREKKAHCDCYLQNKLVLRNTHCPSPVLMLWDNMSMETSSLWYWMPATGWHMILVIQTIKFQGWGTNSLILMANFYSGGRGTGNIWFSLAWSFI